MKRMWLLVALHLAIVRPALGQTLVPDAQRAYGLSGEGNVVYSATINPGMEGQTVCVPGTSQGVFSAVVVEARPNKATLDRPLPERVTPRNGWIGTDDTAALQALVDASSKLGRDVSIPRGTFLVDGVTLRPHARIRGTGRLTKLQGTGRTRWVVNSEKGLVDCSLADMTIAGVGKGPKQGGLFASGLGRGGWGGNYYDRLFLEDFGEEGAKWSPNAIDDRADDVLAIRCLRNDRTEMGGAITLDGTDGHFGRFAAYGGQTGVSPGLLKVGILARGGDYWVSEATVEQCDYGIVDRGYRIRWSLCRALLNMGHGIDPGNESSWYGAVARGNSVAKSGEYYGVVPGRRSTMIGTVSESRAGDAWKQRESPTKGVPPPR